MEEVDESVRVALGGFIDKALEQVESLVEGDFAPKDVIARYTVNWMDNTVATQEIQDAVADHIAELVQGHVNPKFCDRPNIR